MRNKNTVIILLLISLFSCVNNNSNIDNKDKFQFDTIPYILPIKTTEKIYKEVLKYDSIYNKEVNWCSISFIDDTAFLLEFFHNSKLNINTQKFVSNRFLFVKERRIPVYFLTDYIFGMKNNVNIVRLEWHVKRTSLLVNYIGEIIPNEPDTTVPAM